ncbi:DUF2561 family protein [Mycobacterium spongiae]|uniref:DUF2561 family protein n=1 Tax=Mycobacterium spongiae TaxID=886343 RepID=A0A975JYE8_9MYCO|nr:DUF2561 family protein [Mycobacterium spongiae]QUR67996.1 DUF2561 family protein [Mycobacterium spongiae]
MVSRYSAYRRGTNAVSPEIIDRILIGACAAVWLVLVGVSVAAVVALVDLGRGFHQMARNPHTTWVLYAIIVVSALIIAGAIPVLMRARQLARAEPGGRPVGPSARSGRPIRPGYSAKRTPASTPQAPKVKAVDEPVEFTGEAVDRAWLRGTVALAGTIGIALIAVATATYLMAVGHEGASWVVYALAGVVTAAMPAIEWLHVRQLRRVIAEQ